jgi:hypothetical protein
MESKWIEEVQYSKSLYNFWWDGRDEEASNFDPIWRHIIANLKEPIIIPWLRIKQRVLMTYRFYDGLDRRPEIRQQRRILQKMQEISYNVVLNSRRP